MSDTDRIDYLTKVISRSKQAQLEIKPMLDEGDRAKEELLPLLDDTGIERVRKHGVLVTKATKTTYKVRALSEVIAWLEEQETVDENGEIHSLLGRFMTVDAKKLYEAFPDAPGLYVVETPYLSVREDGKE